MPRVTVSRVIAASPADVWATICDLPNAGRWNAAWSDIEITSPKREGPGTTFRAKTADGDSFEFRISEWEAAKRISFVPVRGDDERYAVTLERHTFDLRPTDDGSTHVELTAQASARGLVGHLVALFLWPGHQRHGLEQALDALAAIFESQDE